MKQIRQRKKVIFTFYAIVFFATTITDVFAQSSVKKIGSNKNTVAAAQLKLSTAEYEDRVQAIWIGQIAATLMGFRFEHHTASVERVDQLPRVYTFAPVDDDWYYEMAAIRAFEKYGIDLTARQLGEQWKENSCGTWGSSAQSLFMINKGIMPPESGHPRYNKLWFSIGPQFSADIYGALAPGLPNVAARMAREYGHVNGYAEGVDGGVFVAGMLSLGFSEKDPRNIVRKAAKLIHPSSPYRKCIDMVIEMASQGKTAMQVFDAIEDRWHIEYPATNNAVANGGIVAASLWFGESNFLKTVNLAYAAADFTDADCNAANAAAVIGAMFGIKSIPPHLVNCFGDRIKGTKLGSVVLTPAVDESITELSKRTVVIGKKILQKNGANSGGENFTVHVQEPVTLSPELFTLSDLTRYWNPDWQLERAGFGGAGGGMTGIRGNTYLDGDVLATYPRDEIRGLMLTREFNVNGQKEISFEAGVDSGRVWNLDVFVGNQHMLTKLIAGEAKGRHWETIKVSIDSFQNKTVKFRLYQRVLIPGKEAGNAYWKNIIIK